MEFLPTVSASPTFAFLGGLFLGSVVTALVSHWLRKNKPDVYDGIADKFDK